MAQQFLKSCHRTWQEVSGGATEGADRRSATVVANPVDYESGMFQRPVHRVRDLSGERSEKTPKAASEAKAGATESPTGCEAAGSLQISPPPPQFLTKISR